MKQNADLFGKRVPLNWLHDETLFSWCSRFHVLSGNQLASTTCAQLFGHRQKGSAHDFPSCIGEFVVRTHGHLGGIRAIVEERTLLPFYLPLRSVEDGEYARLALSGQSIGGLKYRLGLAASRLGANHPLKCCVQCMETDVAQHGTPYWHLAHQWPGVLTCPVHHTWLAYSNVKSNGVGRFQWFLPSLDTMTTSTRQDAVPPAIAVSLTLAAIRLAGLPSGTHLKATAVSDAYRFGLARRGLLSGGKKCRLLAGHIGRLYSEFLEQLRILEEFTVLPATHGGAAYEVQKLASESSYGVHPLRHLVLINWLFSSFDEFLVSCTPGIPHMSKVRLPEASAVRGLAIEREQTTSFLSMVKLGIAVSTAAHAVGVDPATGMAWAAREGIETIKRPSRVRGKIKTAMVRALRIGASKESVAKLGGVSIQSVTRLLRTEVGLQSMWHQAQASERKRLARQAWLRVVSQNSLAGANAARMLEPAAYAWLYRNDLSWLKEQIGRLERAQRGGGVRANWDERDRALAREVTLAGLQISRKSPGKRIKLWQLYQFAPVLRPKLRKLDRLPLTEKAIALVVGARRASTSLW